MMMGVSACFYMSFMLIPLFGWRPLIAAVVIALGALSLVWLVRALFGRRAGRIGSYTMIAFLVVIPVWFGIQCSIEMAVPVRFEGDRAIDNDGAIRGLALVGSSLLPAAIMGIIATWLSTIFFFRQPNSLKNTSPA